MVNGYVTGSWFLHGNGKVAATDYVDAKQAWTFGRLKDFNYAAGVNEYTAVPNELEKAGTPKNSVDDDSVDLKPIMDFVYNRLVYEDFGYGDTPELKYVVENIFSKNKERAQMAFINMATKKVFRADYQIIEKFFALLMSLDENYVDEFAMAIILSFLSHEDQSAAEGALTMLDKYGRDQDAYEVALKIRDFDYRFLNDYKAKVIENLSRFNQG